MIPYGVEEGGDLPTLTLAPQQPPSAPLPSRYLAAHGRVRFLQQVALRVRLFRSLLFKVHCNGCPIPCFRHGAKSLQKSDHACYSLKRPMVCHSIVPGDWNGQLSPYYGMLCRAPTCLNRNAFVRAVPEPSSVPSLLCRYPVILLFELHCRESVHIKLAEALKTYLGCMMLPLGAGLVLSGEYGDNGGTLALAPPPCPHRVCFFYTTPSQRTDSLLGYEMSSKGV